MEEHNYLPFFMKRGDIMDKKENKFIKLLEKFDENFKTETKAEIKNVPMLLEIFDRFAEEIYKPSIDNEKYTKQLIKVDEKLRSTLNSRQIKLLEERDALNIKIQMEENEQAFVYGFAMSSQIKEETLRRYTYK